MGSRDSDLTLGIAQFFTNVRQSALNHVDPQSLETFGICSFSVDVLPDPYHTYYGGAGEESEAYMEKRKSQRLTFISMPPSLYVATRNRQMALAVYTRCVGIPRRSGVPLNASTGSPNSTSH